MLQQLVDTVLSTPLDGKALRLQQIMAAQRLTELEFLLPIEVLDAPTLNRITQRHDRFRHTRAIPVFMRCKACSKAL